MVSVDTAQGPLGSSVVGLQPASAADLSESSSACPADGLFADGYEPRAAGPSIDKVERKAAGEWLARQPSLSEPLGGLLPKIAGENKLTPEHLALAALKLSKVEDEEAVQALEASAAAKAEKGRFLFSPAAMDVIVQLRRKLPEGRKPEVRDLARALVESDDPALDPFRKGMPDVGPWPGVKPAEPPATLATHCTLSVGEAVGGGKKLPGLKDLGLVLSNPGMTTDWTAQAAEGRYTDKLIGREAEKASAWAALDTNRHGNVILVGASRVGKTQILRALAQDIIDKKAPARFKNARLFSVDLGAVAVECQVCPAKLNIKKVVDELVKGVQTARAGGVEPILVIDQAERIVESHPSLFALLRERLDDPLLQLHVAGAATPDGYKKLTGEGTERRARFTAVQVEQPPPDELLAMAVHYLNAEAEAYGVKPHPGAAEMAIRLAELFTPPDSKLEMIRGFAQPGAVQRLIERTAAHAARELEHGEGPLLLRSARAQRVLLKEALDQWVPSSTGDDSVEEKKALKGRIESMDRRIRELEAKAKVEKYALETLQTAAQRVKNPPPGVRPAKLAEELKKAQRALDKVIESEPPENQALFNVRLDPAAMVEAVVLASGRNRAGVPNITAEVIAKELTKANPTAILDLRKQLDVLIGQAHAKDVMADASLRRYSGVGAPDRLEDIQFFAGPSGAGKTKLVKIATEAAGKKLERFDGGDFQAFHEISKLIGAPDGYVGYSELGGQLFQLCKKYARPKMVNGETKLVADFTLLFDEAEKFHPRLFTYLMNVIDEAEIRWKGETIYLYDTRIYFTSNLGNQEVFQPHTVHGEGRYDDPDAVRRDFMKVYQTLPPEIRGRLPEPIIFNPHGRKEMLDILKYLLTDLYKRMEGKKIPLTISDAAMNQVVDLVLDKADEFGGRQLDKHTIPNVIETPIANALMRGKPNEVCLDVDGKGSFVVKDGATQAVLWPAA